MIQPRRSQERGHLNHGWLDAYHTFSFGQYQDPAYRGFGDLLVINEDRIQPGRGFGKHGHKNMEIVTYVLSGSLAHQDSTGTHSVLSQGDVQRMTAGTGILHSEMNHSTEHPVHLLQIWILPEQEGLVPGYEEKNFPEESKKNQIKRLVSPTGDGESLRIHQDASISAALSDPGNVLTYSLSRGRRAWVQVASGRVLLNGTELEAGDGAACTNEALLTIEAKTPSEWLVFDLR